MYICQNRIGYKRPRNIITTVRRRHTAFENREKKGLKNCFEKINTTDKYQVKVLNEKI